MHGSVMLIAKLEVKAKMVKYLNTEFVLPSTSNKLQDSEAEARQNRGDGSAEIHSRCELVDNIE